MSIQNLEVETESMAGASRLHVWLLDAKWDVTQLVRFLRGDDVPASFAGMEPYEWIEDALANGGERADFELELARRLAELLRQEPEIDRFWPRPEQVLYNLLSVCANLHQPEVLQGPLREMMERRKLQGKSEDGLDLRGRLRAALASNQSDWDLEETWVRMTQGQVDFLPGNPFHALDAILLMPMRDDMPPLKAIAIGLRSVLPLIEKGQDDPEQVLSQFVQRAKNSYQAGRELVGYLLYRSCAEAWPAWAREVLIPLLECEPCQREILDLNQQLDNFLRQQGNRCAEDRVKGYSVHMASTIQVWFNEIDHAAERRFVAIRLPELNEVNIGAQDLACVLSD